MDVRRYFLSRNRPLGVLSAIALSVAMVGCQSAEPGPGELQLAGDKAALPTMERIALAASRCWFKSGEATFRPYRLAPELNSFSGRPRILIVARDSPESRPLAVIQAEGAPAAVHAFGPLMSEPAGNRMAADLKRWAAGGDACGAAA